MALSCRIWAHGRHCALPDVGAPSASPPVSPPALSHAPAGAESEAKDFQYTPEQQAFRRKDRSWL